MTNRTIHSVKWERNAALGTPARAEHQIDFDADPFVPESWSVLEHKKGGYLKWEASRVELYLNEKQLNGRCIAGVKLFDELKGKQLYNANMLDYLLQYPHLIPGKWRNKYVFFWGTIYRNSADQACVRYLYWNQGRWHWDYGRFDLAYRSHCPAAMLAG